MKVQTLQRMTLSLMILGCLILLFPGFASAHAYIIEAEPASGQVMPHSPEQVSILFNEPVGGAFLTLSVTNASGDRVDLDQAGIDPNNAAKLVNKLKPDLPEGVYTIHWRAVSGDGHPISGTIPFIVGQASSASADLPGSAQDNTSPGLDQTLIRWLQYLGYALYAGVLSLSLFLLPKHAREGSYTNRGSRIWLTAALLLAGLGILLSLPLQIRLEAGLGWGAVWQGELFRQTLKTSSFGTVWWAQALMLLVLAALTYGLVSKDYQRRKRSLARWAAVTLGLMLLAKAFIGHPAAASSRTLAIAADFVHLAAASLWTGGLVALALVMPGIAAGQARLDGQPSLAAFTVRRFSLTASLCVAVLLISGVYGSVLYLPDVGALFNTAYGQVLLVKAGLMILMLALAFFNYRRGAKQQKLGAALWTELASGLVVLVLAALLTNLSPVQAPKGPVHLTEALQGGSRLELNISPAAIGSNRLEVKMTDKDGSTLKGIQQITLKFSSTKEKMDPIVVNLPGDRPQYSADLLLTTSGSWQVDYHILLSTLESIDGSLSFEAGMP
ncbi:hypothetical protein DCC85_02350 [Paenibacillus sp. CAA11]|uniref:copper resistance CopC/CopD family protein n=1 Tax=Paenibacillus sp. CAA11 TaxID=1532905 RepID=UPI000D383977|nr:copper resistance CopC/CopD family protein [Paenibacillus sp. CAA11]AWB43188.1 hypothetical protein DCC85_02350 [Paenibacillus sp. CAA11]